MSQLHPIIEKLREVQANEKKWLLLFSCSLFIACGLGTWILVCLIDSFWRSDSPWLRTTLSMIPIVVILYAGWRILLPSIRFKRELVDVARAIESHHPTLDSNLSLATDFLSSSNRNGSGQLREQLIRRAQSSIGSVDWKSQINTTLPLRATLLMSLVLVFAASILAAQPANSLFAARRTLFPMTPCSWPSMNDLVFLSPPEKIAIGDGFECTVVDRNDRLPNELVLEIDDDSGILKRGMKVNGNQATFELTNITRSIRIRAVGGDDRTDWLRIQVVTAPAIKELAIEVEPPKYSGLPNLTVGPFEKIWAGSRIKLRGKTDKPIVKSELIMQEQLSELPNEAAGTNRRIAVPVSGKGFIYPPFGKWTLSKTEIFQIELTGEDELKGGKNRNFRIPVRIDAPPVVDLTYATSRRIFAPDDRVALQINADDDMKVASLFIDIRNQDKQRLRVDLRLKRSQAQPANSTERHLVAQSMVLDLGKLKASPGDGTFEIRANATDLFGNFVRSNPLVFRIGTNQELSNLVDQRRKSILENLAKILGDQNETRNLVSLILEADSEKSISDQKVRLLDVADGQMNIQDALYGSEGIYETCEEYLSDLGSGTTDQPKQEDKDSVTIAQVQQILTRLRSSVRIAVTQSREASTLAARPKIALSCLELTRKNQNEIIAGLEKLVGQIDVQTRFRECRIAIQKIIKQESEIRSQCLRLSAEEGGQLQKQEIRSKRLFHEQNGISNHLKELSWGLLNDSKQLASPPLADLGQRLKVVEIESKLASEQISKNQMGLAFQTLTRVLEQLERLLDRTETSQANLAPANKGQFDEANSSMQSIQQTFSDLASQLGAWKELDALARKQAMQGLDDLQGKISDLLNKNQNLLSDAARKLLAESKSLVQEIISELNKGRPESARNKMRELRSKLDQVSSELAAGSQQADRLERQERFRKLQLEFALWFELQTKIKVALDAASSSASDVFADLLVMQKELTARIPATREKNQDLFALIVELEKLEQTSLRQENYLKSKNLSQATKTAGELLTLIAALLDSGDKSEPGQRKPQDAKGDNQNTSGEDSSQIQISEFEVQLLRQMQQQILAETKRIQTMQQKNLSAQEKAALTRSTLKLADRQSELIATLKKYLQSPAKQSDSKNTIPDIPEIPDLPELDNIPDLPEMECGPIDSIDPPPGNFGNSQGFGNSQITGEYKGVQETEKQDKEPSKQNPEKNDQEKSNKIESIRPFAPPGQKTDDQKVKQGEDIGEKSDTVRNRLELIQSKMQSVEKLLIQQKLTKENLDIQTEIIEELKFFNTDQQKQNSTEQKSQESGTKKGDQAATGSESSRNPKAKLTESETQNAEIQKRIDEIWGHLPEQVRGSDLNIRAEQFLPKYRELIKAYFKRLALDPEIR